MAHRLAQHKTGNYSDVRKVATEFSPPLRAKRFSHAKYFCWSLHWQFVPYTAYLF